MSYPGRTTAAAVDAIIDDDLSAVNLTPYIDAANELVTEICAVNTAYTADRLEKIERWLSAHFYCIFDPRTKSEGVSGISASYEGNTGMMLQATRYGQQAMLLDTYGGLSVMSKLMEEGRRRRKLGVLWLGERCEGPSSSGYTPFPA